MQNQNGNPAGQQQEGRAPQIEGQLFAVLTELDGFLGRAPLSRQEHAQAQRNISVLAQRLEEFTLSTASLTRELEQLRAAQQAGEAAKVPFPVTEADRAAVIKELERVP